MDTIEAITARLLEVGDAMALTLSVQSPVESEEWFDLRRQLSNAIAEKES